MAVFLHESLPTLELISAIARVIEDRPERVQNFV
ncbi:hypothetical protein XFF6166_1020107 [Xanthomonas citri pv. fuscans]|nr:hypothetical protein XFF6166_1020107 [Xanthomonas citri pv. fuscans]SOO46332.1 hypothetical protein XFF1815_990107 [Xanthomonas citri pv. fuscans]